MWDAIGAAVAAFIGGGLSGWFGRPAAAARAEATKLRFQQHQQLVVGLRAMVHEARSWPAEQTMNTAADYANDPRFIAVSTSLTPAVRARFPGPQPDVPLEADPRHQRLQVFAEEAERLEKLWKLV